MLNCVYAGFAFSFFGMVAVSQALHTKENFKKKRLSLKVENNDVSWYDMHWSSSQAQDKRKTRQDNP